MAPSYVQNTANSCQIRASANLPFRQPLREGYTAEKATTQHPVRMAIAMLRQSSPHQLGKHKLGAVHNISFWYDFPIQVHDVHFLICSLRILLELFRLLESHIGDFLIVSHGGKTSSYVLDQRPN